MTEQMKHEDHWGIIYCPRKRKLMSAETRWQGIVRSLDKNHITYDYVQAEHQGSVGRLTKMLINNGYITIVLVGGDSALNDAVNVLMDLSQEVRNRIAIGVIPNGVMNDFAHFWGMTESTVDEQVLWLKQRRVKKIDIGCVRYTNRKNEACRRYFINCVNIGLVSHITAFRSNLRKRIGSRSASFSLSMLLMLWARLKYKMKIVINGQVIAGDVMTMCIGNSTGYGQTPSAVPYNGWLDVSIVSPAKVAQLLTGVRLFMRGRMLNHKGVTPYRTKKIEIEQGGGAMVSVDGRPMHTPVGAYSVTILPESVGFIIPS